MEDFGRLLALYILEDFGRLMGSLLKYNALEDFQKTSRKSSSALYFRRLPRRLSINVPKSALDLKNLYIKKYSNDLKTEKMSGRLYRSTFIEHTKYISKWKIRTIWLKTCNKKID